jgi:hypothetical protein
METQKTGLDQIAQENGPVVIKSNGSKEYWVYSIEFTEQEYQEFNESKQEIQEY